jgi:predicted esterase
MQERHIVTRKTARYFVLGNPAAGPAELWVVCHGYGQLAAYFIRRFEPLATPGRLIVAPEALSRFYLENPEGGHANARVGATWMTREDRLHEIADYVGYLDLVVSELLRESAKRPDRLVALGFSQGAATVARWAALGGSRVDRAILWGDRLPPDLELESQAERVRAIEWIFVAGTKDPYWPPQQVKLETARLAQIGADYRLIEFDGGHELEPEVLCSLAG